MSDRLRRNEYGQPMGPPVTGWKVPPWPKAEVLEGRYCRLERLAQRHSAELHREFTSGNHPDAGWTYLSYGPFANPEAHAQWITENCAGNDPLFYAVLAGGNPVGIAGYLRIAPPAGSIEVGHIHFGPSLSQTAAATDAMYLMMRHAFELGYRRYEWKCDALNMPSRRAAQRFGFSFEGIFRNATMYKDRSRDTAWFAITDAEWPKLKTAYERWLDPKNFAEGRQRERLSDLTRGGLRNLCDPFAN